MTRPSEPHEVASGLVVGGRGGPEEDLLEDGQEEVFAREEIEGGRIEHHVGEESTESESSKPLQAKSPSKP